MQWLGLSFQKTTPQQSWRSRDSVDRESFKSPAIILDIFDNELHKRNNQ